MSWLDIGAGIGQALPTVMQNVGVLSGIAKDQERLDLERERMNTANELDQAKLGIETQNLGLSKQRLGYEGERLGIDKAQDIRAGEKAIQDTQTWEMAMRAAKRDEELKIRENSDIMPIEGVVKSFPGVIGARGQEYVQSLVQTLFPEAKDSGKLSPAKYKKLQEIMQANKGTIAARAQEDLDLMEHDWESRVHDLKSPENMAKGVEKQTQVLMKAGFTGTPLEAKKMATTTYLESLKPEEDKLAREKMQLERHKYRLGVELMGPEKAKEQEQEAQKIEILKKTAEKVSGEADLLYKAGQKDPAALEGVRIQQKQAKDMEAMKLSTLIQTHNLDPKVTQIKYDTLKDTVFAQVQTQYQKIKGEIEVAEEEGKGMFGNNTKLKKLMTNPTYKLVESMRNLETTQPKLWEDQLKSLGTARLFLTKEQNIELKNAIDSIIAPRAIPGSPEVNATPLVAAALDTKGVQGVKIDVPVPKTDAKIDDFVKFLKAPGMNDAYIQAAITGTSPEYQNMFRKANEILKAEETKGNAKGKIKTSPTAIPSITKQTPTKPLSLSSTMVPGFSPRAWSQMTPTQQDLARAEYVAKRKAAYFSNTQRSN